MYVDKDIIANICTRGGIGVNQRMCLCVVRRHIQGLVSVAPDEFEKIICYEGWLISFPIFDIASFLFQF